MILSRAELYSYAALAGFRGAPADEVVAIALAESGGDTLHIHVNAQGSTAVVNGITMNVPPGTRDRGVLQINDWWNNGAPNHGGLVTDDQAFDPGFSFRWTFNVTQGGLTNLFKAYFVTVQNGDYLKFLTPGGSGPLPNPPPTPTPGTTSIVGQALLDFVSVLKKEGVL